MVYFGCACDLNCGWVRLVWVWFVICVGGLIAGLIWLFRGLGLVFLGYLLIWIGFHVGACFYLFCMMFGLIAWCFICFA